MEHEIVVDCSFDSQAPLMDSSCYAVEVSALDEHLDSVAVACIDWDHCALHDADAERGSSYHFDTLIIEKFHQFSVKIYN